MQFIRSFKIYGRNKKEDLNVPESEKRNKPKKIARGRMEMHKD